MTDGSRHRLLIVDDDPPIRQLLHRIAVRAGFDAEMAKDGAEAMEKLASSSFAIVIVDLMMPRVSGFELVQHIQSLQPRPTIIIATAMTTTDLTRLDDSMVRRVLRKPFDIDAVAKALVETASEIASGSAPAHRPPVVEQVIPAAPPDEPAESPPKPDINRPTPG